MIRRVVDYPAVNAGCEIFRNHVADCQRNAGRGGQSQAGQEGSEPIRFFRVQFHRITVSEETLEQGLVAGRKWYSGWQGSEARPEITRAEPRSSNQPKLS